MKSTRSIFFAGALLVLVLLLMPASVSAATTYVDSSTGDDSTGNGSAGAPYRSFTKAYASSTGGDTIDLTGTFTWTDVAETSDAITTGFTLSKGFTIAGHGPDQTIIQASTTDNTADRRVFTIASSTTFQNLTIRYGKQASTLGGCVLINSTASTTFSGVKLYNCRATHSSSSYGGAIYASATTTIINSSLHNNSSVSSGSAIGTGANLVLTNTTISGNYQSSLSGGGALYLGSAANATTTNVTITGNASGFGGGVSMYSTGVLNMKNTIVASNTPLTSGRDFYRNAGTLQSSGYNIFGGTLSIATTTGDWTDLNDDGTFILGGVGTTGSLNMDSSAGPNDSTAAYTVAVLAGSIAINNGTTTDNGSISIPANDLRGATRNGAIDIGAYEFDGGGLTVSVPTSQATGVSFSQIAYNQMRVSWTNSTSSRRVVFMKEGNSGTASPVDGERYTPSSVFGRGSQIGSSGWYAIHDTIASTTVFVTGISSSTSYIVQVFEYNGVGTGQAIYNTTTDTNNPNTQITYTPVMIYSNSGTGNDLNDGTINSPYLTFHKAFTSASGGDTIDLIGTFNWLDAGETGDVTTTGYTLNKDLTIAGHGPDQTIIQASTTDNTADRRVFTIASSTTFRNLSIRYGKQSSTSGGCILGNSTAATSFDYVEIYNCRGTNASSYGGGIYMQATTTIANSAFYGNASVTSGAAIASVGNITMTNTTVYGNQNSSGSGGGGGFYLGNSGNATTTNVTITKNTAGFGGGVSMYSTGVLSMKNTLVASNTPLTAGRDFYRTAGTLQSNGYNIMGGSLAIATTTGDWTDTNDDLVFNKLTATGTLSLDTTGAMNDNPYYTRTVALLAGSIAINNGTTTAHGTISIPAIDQRSASRVGETDIGAFEYGASFVDSTAPVISSIASSTTATTATVTWATNESATSTLDFGTTAGYGTASSSAVSATSHSIVMVGLTESTTYHFRISSWDSSGNVATSSDLVLETAASADPVSVSVAAATTTAAVTWTTNAAASSVVHFGATAAYSSSTAESDTSPRVTSHSVLLSGLPRCAKVYYVVNGESATGARATSSDATFFTGGCTGSASITSGQAAGIQAASGGSLQNGNISVVVPIGFTATSSAAVFQANELDATTFSAAAGAPAGLSRAGSGIFNLKAVYDTVENLDAFATPLDIVFSYDESDIAGLIESSLAIYRYDDGWFELDSCSVDTGANEVTCQTRQFSDFAIFGDADPAASNASSAVSNASGRTAASVIDYGCRDPKSANFSMFVSHVQSMCAYATSAAAGTGAQNVSSVQAAIAGFSFGRNLKAGDTGNDVKELQKALNAKGFIIAVAGPGSKGNETSKFGSATKVALIRFQKEHGIRPAVGYFGPITRKNIKSAN